MSINIKGLRKVNICEMGIFEIDYRSIQDMTFKYKYGKDIQDIPEIYRFVIVCRDKSKIFINCSTTCASVNFLYNCCEIIDYLYSVSDKNVHDLAVYVDELNDGKVKFEISLKLEKVSYIDLFDIGLTKVGLIENVSEKCWERCFEFLSILNRKSRKQESIKK